jgi:hypothetical protein
MKKIYPPSLSHLGWGTVLLPISLLLIAVSGILQLYEVQAVWFPRNYHATQIDLIKKECIFIDKGFVGLRTGVAKLEAFCASPKPSVAGSSPPQSLNGARITLDSAWPATLHAAKKNRVYVARKLKYIDAMLQSMQRAIEQQETSNDVALSHRRPDFARTLRRIQIIRTRCQTYSSELDRLTEKLNQLEGCSNSSFVKNK